MTVTALPLLAAATSPEAVERQVVAVLLQLAVIMVAARVFAALARRVGQPAVVGEIVAGLILGPSLFSHIPIDWVQNVWRGVFHPAHPDLAELPVAFTILSQLGLIFLLFMIGLEFDFSHLRTNNVAATGISVMGVAAPFALGAGLALVMHRTLDLANASPGIPLTGFVLFMGTAMSITAIPILGRIMMEMNITRSRLGAITITAAAIDDATGWILLATVSAIVKSEFNVGVTLRMLALSLAFAAFMIFAARPVLKRWARRAVAMNNGRLGLDALAGLFVVMFVCAIATSEIGIFAIFGAFVLGAVLSDEHAFRKAIQEQLTRFITVFFLPIFFTYTGLRTDVGSLHSPLLWLFAALVSAAAILGKFGGCTLAARLSGLSPRESGCVGIMMNTRALMELIVINVGYELKVIPKDVFCMLVLMALLTTVMTSPILLRLMRGTELEPLIASSGFVSPRRRRGPAPAPLEAASG